MNEMNGHVCGEFGERRFQSCRTLMEPRLWSALLCCCGPRLCIIPVGGSPSLASHEQAAPRGRPDDPGDPPLPSRLLVVVAIGPRPRAPLFWRV